MQLTISAQEQEDLVRGLQMRICVIETGDPVLRASDAVQMGKHTLVRALSAEQRAVVVRFESLIQKLLSTR